MYNKYKTKKLLKLLKDYPLKYIKYKGNKKLILNRLYAHHQRSKQIMIDYVIPCKCCGNYDYNVAEDMEFFRMQVYK
jgi:hypothetical protein